MFKRIGLFLLTNVAVLVVLGVVLNIVSAVFGINFSNVAGKGQSYGTLLIFAGIVGFSGSIISLLMSKTIAKSTMGVQMIDVNHPSTKLEAWLVDTVTITLRKPVSRCRKSVSMKAKPMLSQPAQQRILPWWLFPQVFFPA